jgi:hypothetical protein
MRGCPASGNIPSIILIHFDFVVLVFIFILFIIEIERGDPDVIEVLGHQQIDERLNTGIGHVGRARYLAAAP